MDPVSVKHTSAPFPARSRAGLVIEVPSAGAELGPPEAQPSARSWGSLRGSARPTILGVPEGPPEPIIGVLQEIWSSTAQACEGLRPDAWDLPTDCPGWTVRDQLSHVIGTELGLLGQAAPPLPDPMPAYVRNPLGETNEAWIEERRTMPGTEVLAEFIEVTGRRLAELAGFPPERWEALGWSPAGEAPYRDFMELRAFDSWVHEQDIRLVIERPGGRFGRAEEIALAHVAMGMPYVVGRKVAPPDATTVVFDVTGPLARRLALQMNGKRAEVLLRDPPERPTARLVLSSEQFIRLGCGREAPGRVLASGAVEIDGDEELGAQVIGAMDFMI